MNDFPQLTNAILGTKFKIVPGYASTPQMNEALERGEVEGVAGFGWFALNAQVPQWVTEKKITIITQFGATRHRLLPDVPLMLDLAKSEADRQALLLLFGRTEYGRPYFLPPDVPAERVEALRRAFDATMKDEGFIADAAKIGFEVDPLSGEQVQAVGRGARQDAARGGGAGARGAEPAVTAVMLREGGASSNHAALPAESKPRRRGVLDHPPSRMMTALSRMMTRR